MRILFDVSAAVHHHAGIGRYADELLRALVQNDRDDEFHTFYNEMRAGERLESPLHTLPGHCIGLPAKPFIVPSH